MTTTPRLQAWIQRHGDSRWRLLAKGDDETKLRARIAAESDVARSMILPHGDAPWKQERNPEAAKKGRPERKLRGGIGRD